MSIARYEDADTPSVFTPARAQDTDSWVEVMAHVVRLAQEVSTTDFVPRGLRGNVPATAAAMLYGREVGLPPMTALTSIHVVDGRPGMSAEAMRSLVYAAGHEIVFDEATGSVCRMRARRRGSVEWTALAYSRDMAREANLLGKDNWKKYPRDMLIARCSTALCRMVFPDVIHGFRSLEEIADLGDASLDAVLEPSSEPRTIQRRRPSKAAKVEEAMAAAIEQAPQPAEPPLEPISVGPEAAEIRPTSGSTTAGPEPRTSGPAPEQPGPASEGEVEPGPRGATRPVLRMVQAQLRRLGFHEPGQDAERHAILGLIVGRPITSSSDLSQLEAEQVHATLMTTRTPEALEQLLSAAGVAGAPQGQEEPPWPAEPTASADDVPLPVEDPPGEQP